MGAHFCNVDLNLRSKRDLLPLIRALQTKGLTWLAPDDTKPPVFLAAMEGKVHITQKPSKTLQALMKAVEALDEEGRHLWDQCETREFDFGFDCSENEPASIFDVPTRLVRSVADLGASLAITIYTPSIMEHHVYPADGPPPKSQ